MYLVCEVGSECVVFFFQAEDGIRDGRVTGVQTCALPILGQLRQTLQTPSRGDSVASGASRAHTEQVSPCQHRSAGGNPRQLSRGPKIGFGEGRPAASSVGRVAFSSQISRCANASPTTRACRGRQVSFLSEPSLQASAHSCRTLSF